MIYEETDAIESAAYENADPPAAAEPAEYEHRSRRSR